MSLTPYTGPRPSAPASLRSRRLFHRCAAALCLTLASVLSPAAAWATPTSLSGFSGELVAAPEGAGHLAVNPDTAPVGANLVIDGAGFTPDEAIDLHWPGEAGPVLVSLTADDAGAFSTTVPLPETPVGDRALVALGAESGQTADDWIEVTPSLGVSPASAAPGTDVTLSVRGLGADEAFNVYWGDATGPAWAFGRTDGAGSATVRAATPGKPPGHYDLVVTGLTSNQQGVGSLVLLDPAADAITPTSDAAETMATPTDPIGAGSTPVATIDAGPDPAESATVTGEAAASNPTPVATAANATPEESPASESVTPEPAIEPAVSTPIATMTGGDDVDDGTDETTTEPDDENAAADDDEPDQSRRERKKDASEEETRVNLKIVKANKVRDQFGLPLIPEDAVPTSSGDADNGEPAADANGDENAEEDVAAAMIATMTAGDAPADPPGDAGNNAAPASESAGTVPVQISDPSGAAESTDSAEFNADAPDAADGAGVPIDGTGEVSGDAAIDDGAATGPERARPERTRRNDPAPDSAEAPAPDDAPTGEGGEIAQPANPEPNANRNAIQGWQAPSLAPGGSRRADENSPDSAPGVIRPADGGGSPVFEAKKRKRTGEDGSPGSTTGVNAIPPVPPIPVIPTIEEPPTEPEPESDPDEESDGEPAPDDVDAPATEDDPAAGEADNPDKGPRDDTRRDGEQAPDTGDTVSDGSSPETTGSDANAPSEPDPEAAPEAVGETASDESVSGASDGTDPADNPESEDASTNETGAESAAIATVEPAPTPESPAPDRSEGETTATATVTPMPADSPPAAEAVAAPTATPDPATTPAATEPPAPRSEAAVTATPEAAGTPLLAAAAAPVTREVTLAPVADTTVAAVSPDEPQPPIQVTVLPAGGPDGAVVYVTFAVDDIAPGTLVSARLFLTGSVGWGPAGDAGVVPGQGIDEASLTYNIAPGEQFTAADRSGATAYIDNLAPGVEQSADVTSAITGPGFVTFVFRGLSWNGLAIASRESPTPPRLVLSLAE